MNIFNFIMRMCFGLTSLFSYSCLVDHDFGMESLVTLERIKVCALDKTFKGVLALVT